MDQTAQQRIDTRFDLFDTNGNGHLEAADFDDLANRIIDGLGTDGSSPKAQALRDGYRRYWQGLVGSLDRDNDGRISREEFAGAVHDEAWYDQHARPFAQALAAIADTSDDGTIDQAEFTICLQIAGFPADRVDALFARLDPAGKGRIATGALEGMIHDFYVSDSPTAASVLVSGS